MTMPSDVPGRRSVFDRFADVVARTTARAWFFVACVVLVAVWIPSIAWLQVDTWQLVINTLTTIITFLLVGLMQNTGDRANRASQQKLNALSAGVLKLLETLGHGDAEEARELREAVGIERQESSS